MKVYIKTFGCAANINDSEIMAALLKKAGHEISDELGAEAIIINTCAVKGKTESHFKYYLNSIKPRKLIVAGCMAQAQSTLVRKLAPGASLIGPYEINRIAELLDDERQELLGVRKENKACLMKERANQVINIVQVNEGCLGNCSFCITKLAKPLLFSYPEKLILEDIRLGIKDGCKEVWITSQDTGAYGKDSGTNLPTLISKASRIKGKFWIRIGMLNPDLVNDDFISAFKQKKVFKFLHIPVQSGSNQVLKVMNRKYAIASFKRKIKKFRKAIPEVTISTDVICGFPGESESQFKQTLKLIEETKPDVLNISRFWPRPGTRAALMKQLNGRETKRRSAIMHRLHRKIALAQNKKWLGWKGEVLVDELGTEGTFISRNHAYKPIVIRSRKSLLGSFVKVQVIECHEHYLVGKIIA